MKQKFNVNLNHYSSDTMRMIGIDMYKNLWKYLKLDVLVKFNIYILNILIKYYIYIQEGTLYKHIHIKHTNICLFLYIHYNNVYVYILKYRRNY